MRVIQSGMEAANACLIPLVKISMARSFNVSLSLIINTRISACDYIAMQ
jgi:hypothetical protein